MSSGSAWTGGLANREYRRGSHAEPTLTDELREYFVRQVKLYLADVRKYRLEPSEKGCLDVVYTANDEQKQYVTDTYRHLTGARPREEGRYGQ